MIFGNICFGVDSSFYFGYEILAGFYAFINSLGYLFAVFLRSARQNNDELIAAFPKE